MLRWSAVRSDSSSWSTTGCYPLLIRGLLDWKIAPLWLLKKLQRSGLLEILQLKTRCKAAWTIETKFPKRSTLKIFCQLHRAFCKGSQSDFICICTSLEVLILHLQPLTVNQTGLCGKTLCLLLDQWFKAGLAFWRQKLLSWVFSLNMGWNWGYRQHLSIKQTNYTENFVCYQILENYWSLRLFKDL